MAALSAAKTPAASAAGRGTPAAAAAAAAIASAATSHGAARADAMLTRSKGGDVRVAGEQLLNSCQRLSGAHRAAAQLLAALLLPCASCQRFDAADEACAYNI